MPQILNRQKALQLWGSLSDYLPQLSQFLVQQSAGLAKAVAAWQAGRFDDVQKIAHAIKGVSANLALEQLSRLCAELEQAARLQQQQRTGELLQQVQQLWPQHEQALQQLNEQAAVIPAVAVQRLDDQTLMIKLMALQSALQRHELDDELLQLLAHYAGTHQAMILSLLDAVNDFDFIRAQNISTALQQRINTGQRR